MSNCDSILRRINRASSNVALAHAEFTKLVIADAELTDFYYLQDRIDSLESDCDDLLNAVSRGINLLKRCTESPRRTIKISEPRRTTRIVPDPVDEMNDGSVNFESMPPDHPYFRDTPLVYVHGGPSTCILCKETHPCGCRPPTPADRSSMQSPPPVTKKSTKLREAIPEFSKETLEFERMQKKPRKPKAPKKKECIYDMWYPCTMSPPSGPCDCGCGINKPPRDAQAIPEESSLESISSQSTPLLCKERSRAPTPEIQMSDSMKALLEDKVMKR